MTDELILYTIIGTDFDGAGYTTSQLINGEHIWKLPLTRHLTDEESYVVKAMYHNIVEMDDDYSYDYIVDMIREYFEDLGILMNYEVEQLLLW